MFYRIRGIRKIILFLQNIIFNFIYRSVFKNKVILYGLPLIKICKGSVISCGYNLTMISDPYFSEPGVNHPVILRTLNKNAKLIIGNDVGISGASICAAKGIEIGDSVLIGANVLISDTDFHPIEPFNRRYNKENIKLKEVKIGNNVFIGANAIILKGTEIGENSIIGAGSVVCAKIPSNQIWAGDPAKFIRNL